MFGGGRGDSSPAGGSAEQKPSWCLILIKMTSLIPGVGCGYLVLRFLTLSTSSSQAWPLFYLVVSFGSELPRATWNRVRVRIGLEHR